MTVRLLISPGVDKTYWVMITTSDKGVVKVTEQLGDRVSAQ